MNTRAECTGGRTGFPFERRTSLIDRHDIWPGRGFPHTGLATTCADFKPPVSCANVRAFATATGLITCGGACAAVTERTTRPALGPGDLMATTEDEPRRPTRVKPAGLDCAERAGASCQ